MPPEDVEQSDGAGRKVLSAEGIVSYGIGQGPLSFGAVTNFLSLNGDLGAVGETGVLESCSPLAKPQYDMKGIARFSAQSHFEFTKEDGFN